MIDDRHRHRYANRTTTVAHRVVANAPVLDTELNDQHESNPLALSTRSARASREVQSDAQQRDATRDRALRRRQKTLYEPVNIAEVSRIGAPTCDVNAHLNMLLQLELMCGMVIMRT